MNEELIMKYSIGIGIALACFIAFLAISFLHDKQKKRRRNIIIHIIQAILLCSLVAIISQYCEMAVVDFKLHFISFQMINFFSYLAIALILMRKFFLLINLLEKSQITLLVIMILLFGEHFGMSLSGLMTFGGLGGIAIGMASKDVMSNLFSGVMLYFDRPFNIGDWVRSPDRNIEGTVVEIGWRITKIMTFDHRPLYIPNSVFSSISVENPGRMTNRRIETELGLRYEDSDKVGVIVEDIRTMLQQNDKIDTKQTLLVYFNQFADSSLNIMVYCFTKTTVWAEWLDAQQEVYLKMIDIVHQHGADFAFPSQTVYIEKSSPVSP